MKNLKIARILKGYTQRDLAEIMDVNINTVSRWECGSNLITVDKLLRLSEILETTTDFLLGRVS